MIAFIVFAIIALAMFVIELMRPARGSFSLRALFADQRGYISPANWVVFRSTANTVIGAAWTKNLPLMVPRVATKMPSDSTQEVYGWTGKLPKMRLWTGPRVSFQHAPQTYTLVNQPFEGTLEIDRFDLDDDKFGVYYRDLADLAEQARFQPEYMLRDLRENSGDQTGARQLGLDGLTAFNTAHPVDLYNSKAGTYSNDFTAGGFVWTVPKAGGGTTTVTVGGAFSPSAVFTVVAYMMQLKGEDGEALGINPDLLEFHTLLRGEAELVLRSKFFSPPQWGGQTGQVGNADNPIDRYGLDFLINPLLTQPFTWYTHDTRRAFMPYIHQVREATKTVPRVSEDDPNVFDSHKFLYGMWDRQAVGWGPSFLFSRSAPA